MQKKKLVRITIAIAILPLVLFLLALTSFSLSYRDKIYPNVQLKQLKIGAMSKTKAKRLISAADRRTKFVTLRWLDKSKSVPKQKLGLTVDAQKSAQRAFLVGRQGTLFQQLIVRTKLMLQKPYIVKPIFYFNQKQAEKSLKELAVFINQPAANAQLILNPKQVKIIPHQNAQELPMAENLAVLKQAFTKKVIKLKVKVTKPEVTTEALKKLKVETLMSEFATVIPPGPLNRYNNIKLAAGKLNNWQIKPGEVFSFNAAVGPRTTKAGYLPAPVIEAGNLTLGVGGGICQVSTTLYNAAMLAGLPIKERYLHSNYISAYPAGRDATVVYNALDLKFKNDTDGTIIIKSEVANGKITFWLYGPKTNRQVEFSQPVIFNIVPFPVKEVVDPALPAGVKLKAQAGVPGRSVKVIRTVKKNSRILFSEEIFSRYTPRQEIIKVGPTPETTAPLVTTETVAQ